MNTTRWLIGFAGTWFILAAMSDINDTAELASALAISVAVAATFVLGPQAADNLRIKVG